MVRTSGVEHVVDPAEFRAAGAALPPGGAQPLAGPRRPAVRAGCGAAPRWRCPGCSATASQRSAPPTDSASSARPAPICRAPSRSTSGATQVGACTPLVTEVIGTSSASNPGHSPANISRLTCAVQRGDAVGALGQPQPHHGHVEQVRLAAAGRSPCRARGSGPTSTPGSSPSSPKWRATSSRSKRSMPAGTGVWVVKTVPARTASRAASKSEPVVGEFADALQAEEAGVALVGVEDLGRGVAGDPAVGAHGAHAADAEQHLLEQPVLAAAAVEPVGDLALRGAVVLHVGVEQQQRHPADLGLPDGGAQRAGRRAGRGRSGRARRRPRAAGSAGSSLGSRTG